MLRHLRFKGKVLFFVLLILAAFVVHAVQAFLHYRDNQSAWQQEHLTRQISVLIHQIEKDADHAYQAVEQFLRLRDERIAARASDHMRAIFPKLHALDELGVMLEDRLLEEIEQRVNQQLELFLRIRDKLFGIGVNENVGEHGRLRTEIHKVELVLRQKQAYELLASMLQLRRHEKDFMDRKQLVYLDQFHLEASWFQALLARSDRLDAGEQRDIRAWFTDYSAAFYEVVGELLQVNQWIEEYRRHADESEDAVHALIAAMNEVYKRHDALQGSLLFDQFLRSQVMVFAILLGIGGLLLWFQYDFLRAVMLLNDTACRVAAGEVAHIEVERGDEVGELARSLKTMQEGLIERNQDLEQTIRELQTSERENARALDLRYATSMILQLSLQSLTLEELLLRALRVVLAVPWLGVEQRGAIFLYNPRHDRLEMVVHHDLSPALLELCREVPLGHCLCGRAGQSREVVMSRDLDVRHETRFEGIRPHGHYCIPILLDQQLLGVLNVYLSSGHEFEDEEVLFLKNIANTLAGLISRRQAEQNLTQLLATLDAKVIERTKRLREKIRELEQTRHALIAREKLASLGRLVAGIAHEVNTPIGVAYSASTQLLDECRLIERMLAADAVDVDELLAGLGVVQEVSTLVVRNLQRASELIRSFKRASIDQSSEAVREYRVSEVVGDVLVSLHNAFKKSTIAIEVQCPESLQVVGVPGYLNQILTNLLLNSLLHGFEEGQRSGRIEIRFGLQERQLELIYADTGVGMSAEARERAFEPFFTTNRGGGGSGLGLYICYGLITSRLHGTIDLISEVGQGVRFVCRWPVTLRQETGKQQIVSA